MPILLKRKYSQIVPKSVKITKTQYFCEVGFEKNNLKEQKTENYISLIPEVPPPQ
jgi:hypothetical protein